MSTDNPVERWVAQGQVLPFAQHDPATQKAIYQYMAVDGEAWDPNMTSEEYLRRYGDQAFGTTQVPARELLGAINAHPEHGPDWFKTYQEFSDRPDIRRVDEAEGRGVPADSTETWPVILDRHNGEVLEDGWHRLHHYLKQGVDPIPAVYYPDQLSGGTMPPFEGSFTPDVPTTEDALAAILSSPLSPLPPQEQRLGSDVNDPYWHQEQCASIALAHHRQSGWPLHVLYDGPELAHVFTRNPSQPSQGFDIKGVRPVESIASDYPAEYEHRIQPVTEGQLISLMGDDDDQPLYSYDPDAEQVVQAIQSGRTSTLRVSWWEMDPGEVYIHAEGGTPDDRHYASTLVAIELESHGYRRAQFDLDEAEAVPCPHCGMRGEPLVADSNEYWCPGCQREFKPPYADSYIPERWERDPLEELYDRPSGLSPHDPRDSSVRTASWPDIMAKAKRLIQSGQVQLLRNGFNNIIGHVIGDHGDYETEISRDDPNSRAITGWQCSCPWDQYAWQRTRKYKKFEGRPCAHTLALYWKALSTPLDEQLSEEQAQGLGTGQKLGPPSPSAPGPQAPGLPRSFGPEGDILQGDQLQMGNKPPEALGGPPGPAQAPLAPPPGGPTPSGVIPPFPAEQIEQPWAGPGTTPGGGVSPPGAVSVPGAKPQNFMNPIQNPGTLSKVAVMTLPQEKREWESLPTSESAELYREPSGWSVRKHWGQNVNSVGRAMHNCWQGVEPSDVYPGHWSHWCAVHDPHGIPRAAFSISKPDGRRRWRPDELRGTRNKNIAYSLSSGDMAAPEAEPAYRMCDKLNGGEGDYADVGGQIINHPAETDWDQFDNSQTVYPELPPSNLPADAPWMQEDGFGGYRQAKTSAEFNPPEIVRLKKPMYGIAEGPVQGQYGDGSYREVPEGSTGEVLSQDESTGWVEIIVPLDDSGPHQPYHVRTFVEPGDIEHTNQAPPGPFIRRRSKLAGPMDDFMDRLDSIPGAKRVDPIPNEELTYQPGDRVTMEYAHPAPRSAYGLPGEGHICPNTGTVVNVREPGRHVVDQDAWYDMGLGPNGGREVISDSPTYDVQWDMGASRDFSSYHEPGQIGEAIEQHRLWPEGHENTFKSVVDPHAPAAIPEHWPEQYEP